jgi:tRNA dimethylallyltransferase
VKVIVISGPTASGKTDISIEVAKRIDAEIVNFDSLLLYREINIGTAKPSLNERQNIPHHMIDIRSINEPMNAADYAREALPVINEILERKKNVVLVGGSGFYLQALLKGMYDSPSTPSHVQEKSEQLYQAQGIAPFLEILQKEDPLSYSRYHENDHYRIRRAVEHWWTNGSPLSSERMKKDEINQSMSSISIHGWNVLHIYLDLPKEEHQQIIINRTDNMIKAGLIPEVENILAQGFTGKEKPLQCIGYIEVLDWLAGKYNNFEECRERIIISTRQLAKSQRTWFNRDNTKLKFHPLRERQNIFHHIELFLNH